ncbi:MAG TPA: CoA-transferase [Acidimicrobiia bacterium]|nr:CoA-transferase [Acidimicrobiia bacterium]
MSAYSRTELMTIAMARSFRDGEVVVMGAMPTLPLAAARLAKTLWAPNLSYVVGGSGAVNPTPDWLPASSCDPTLRAARSILPLPDVVLLEGRGDALDVFCAGGLQIDATGACNLICVGDWNHPVLRGPGTVGLPFLPAVRRSVLYTSVHDRRTLVERVDFVSGPGHEASARFGSEGPSLLVTPLATFDFDPETKRTRLRTVHPGVDPALVEEQTGFELTHPWAGITPEPTSDELETLRSVDPSGMLR